jgi:HK97 family phage prohead protease
MVTEYRSDREKLIGVEERRRGAERLEFREDKKTGEVILEGYAATYDPYDVHGGPTGGGWVEQLSMTAFDQTLGDKPDVQLLINHEGTPLARTTSGNLKLTRDRHGLRVWASLDPTDPDVQRLVPKMRRHDMDEMSFAFRVNDQTWDTSYSHRTINSLSLEKGDVSVVNYGMNPGTKATLSADAVGMLAQLSQEDLVELRSAPGVLDRNVVKRAAAALMTLSGAPVPPGLGTIMPAPVRAAQDAPYGNVKYADPGYKSDGKKRYPIDTEAHTKAAWSYINMPKNQKGYSPAQVSSIKGRIKGRLKELGVDVSESKSAASLDHIDLVPRADGNTALVAVMTDGSRVTLPSQRSGAPQDMPVPARMPNSGSFTPAEGDADWHPDTTTDPHEDPYDEGMMGDMPGSAPVPDNIMGGGSFSGQHPTFTQPAVASDPHDISIDQEMLAMAMDPHEDPYDFGAYPAGGKLTPMHTPTGTPESGGDPHDTPYTVGSPVSAGEVNVSEPPTSGGGRSSVDPGTPPQVGTEPVDGDGRYDWTSGAVSTAVPSEQLDAAVGERAADAPDGDMGYNPETGDIGEGRAVDDSEDAETPAAVVELDLCMAEALDRTIVHAYKLSAPENVELRKALAVARRQLTTMRGLNPVRNDDIAKKLAEMRSEIGAPDTATVSGGLAFLRSAGTAPVGYRGLLDHDPELHMTTASERLAFEAKEKRERARVAASDSDKASERLKLAQREAELNAVIRRHRKAG